MISNLNFDNLSTNTNTVLGLIIDQCVDRRVPHCTFSMTALRDKTKFSKQRIQMSLKQLEDLGYINISRVPMGGYRYYLDGESIAIYTNEVEKYSGSTRF
jgi:hypothetical protein